MTMTFSIEDIGIVKLQGHQVDTTNWIRVICIYSLHKIVLTIIRDLKIAVYKKWDGA